VIDGHTYGYWAGYGVTILGILTTAEGVRRTRRNTKRPGMWGTVKLGGQEVRTRTHSVWSRIRRKQSRVIHLAETASFGASINVSAEATFTSTHVVYASGPGELSLSQPSP
jgi:hypothetical protein